VVAIEPVPGDDMTQVALPIAVSPMNPSTAVGLWEVAIDPSPFALIEEVTVSSGTALVWGIRHGAASRLILESTVPIAEGMTISGSGGSRTVVEVVSQPDLVASGVEAGHLGFLQNRRELFRIESVSPTTFEVAGALPTGFHRAIIQTSTTDALGFVLPETLDGRHLVPGKASLGEISSTARLTRQQQIVFVNSKRFTTEQTSIQVVAGLERPTLLTRIDHATTSGSLAFVIFGLQGESMTWFPNDQGTQFHVATTGTKSTFGAMLIDDLWVSMTNDAHENFAITLTLEEMEE
jgi:hypothetical protein